MNSKSFIAIPPGETLKEVINQQGYTQKEFALRLGLSEKHVSNLINAKAELTKETAEKLESVLGIPSSFWNDLEARYREELVKVEQENKFMEEMEITKKVPYSEMVANGWIDKASSSEKKIKSLRTFFGVANLNLLTDSDLSRVAFRELSKENRNDLKLLVWLTQAKKEASSLPTSKINLKLLQANLGKIRELTLKKQAFDLEELRSILSECGLALIILPHLKGSFLHGLTFKYKNKIVVGLTIRGKDLDKFWFSLFHEIGHIVLNHIVDSNEEIPDKEEQADTYAKNILIPEDEYEKFISGRNFKKQSIIDFSKRINIDTGIVVGRLQKDKLISYLVHNDLKSKFESMQFIS